MKDYCSCVLSKNMYGWLFKQRLFSETRTPVTLSDCGPPRLDSSAPLRLYLMPDSKLPLMAQFRVNPRFGNGLIGPADFLVPVAQPNETRPSGTFGAKQRGPTSKFQ